ncbi:MAG TPA: hypothetical protein VFE24_07785 [Pirellulales bacterium]|jgi:hypothetical protein|nr:hypothetical protein [Pirellulales bacterium]
MSIFPEYDPDRPRVLDINGQRTFIRKVVATFKVTTPSWLPFREYTIRVVHYGHGLMADPNVIIRNSDAESLDYAGGLCKVPENMRITPEIIEETVRNCIKSVHSTFELESAEQKRVCRLGDFYWKEDPVPANWDGRL